MAPSILAADFSRLGEHVSAAEQGGSDRIHIDVMDGHFVPNISMGMPIIKSLRKVTGLTLETHLMITDPNLFLSDFANAGSDTIIVHWEGNNNLHRTVHMVKLLNKRIGLAINPATPAMMLEEILPDLDQVLIMTVDPGFGHQHFLSSTLNKIQQVSRLIKRLNPVCELEVDGGIDATTAPMCVTAGANVLVAGTAIFGNDIGVVRGMEQLKEAATSKG